MISCEKILRTVHIDKIRIGFQAYQDGDFLSSIYLPLARARGFLLSKAHGVYIMKEHKIVAVASGSIAQELDLAVGDVLLSINGHEIKDILDYRWHMAEENLLIEIKKPDNEIWELEVEKDSDEELGLSFTFMNSDRRCSNNCIFCFVDQQPPGLRDSLYIKDDDPYQSFALGNYITLTNLRDVEIDQIIKHRLSPMRISVHSANMKLRQMMMGNKKAGELFKILDRFHKANIEMHFQVVLCKGINDGSQLDFTIGLLQPLGKSLAIVPVGLTCHREGLYPLEGFTREDAINVIMQVEGWQSQLKDSGGGKFVFLSDEWYVLAGLPTPDYSTYEDFPQLDNGVGMMALFEDEFLEEVKKGQKTTPKKIGIITGQAAGDFIYKLAKVFTESFPDITIDIHVIRNDFYGHEVTVSGLITGRDIIAQLKGRVSGLTALFIPGNAFRKGTHDMLCGTTLEEISEALGVTTIIGSSHGGELCNQMRVVDHN